MEFIHVTGYWFLENADTSTKDWKPPDDLVKFMTKARNEGKKL